MIQNSMFRECLSSISEERLSEFTLSHSIAERIVEVLKEKSMTQRDLAQKLGKRESEISKWLTGRHNFTISTLSHIGSALGSDIITVSRAKYDTSLEACSEATE